MGTNERPEPEAEQELNADEYGDLIPNFQPSQEQKADLQNIGALAYYWSENVAGDDQDWNDFQDWLEEEEPILGETYYVYLPGMGFGVNVALRAPRQAGYDNVA